MNTSGAWTPLAVLIIVLIGVFLIYIPNMVSWNKRRRQKKEDAKWAKRKGFTMIELIFVIVIIGILTAVAIPKMAEMRDAKLQQSVQQHDTETTEWNK